MEILIKDMETESEMLGKGNVHWQSWHETYSNLLSKDYLQTITKEKCHQRTMAYPKNTLIAQVGKQVIGFACYGECTDEDVQEAGEIFAIYVLEKYHGQKIGYQLMQVCLERLSDFQAVFLWVLKDNQKAIDFYEKCGFVIDGQQKELLLGQPITAIRMQLGRNLE